MGKKTDALRDARDAIVQLTELIGDDDGCDFCNSICEHDNVDEYGFRSYRVRTKPYSTVGSGMDVGIVWDEVDGFQLVSSYDFEPHHINAQTTKGATILSATLKIPITHCPMCGTKLWSRL